MRVVVALGGNALLRRDEQMTVQHQRVNIGVACDRLSALAGVHELVISHGNGPQIGFLALEEASYTSAADSPLDVLGAETQGMIGYLIEQELANRLPAQHPLATLLTMVEVDPDDPAFGDPTKPIGPRYDRSEADELTATRGWTFVRDGAEWRRVVASPVPLRIIESTPIRWLLEHGCVVICAGGGGIPTAYREPGVLSGVEAVIDKDSASRLLAEGIDADMLILATDTAGAFIGFDGPDPTLIERANPDALLAAHRAEFAAGSMLPKVTAASDFAARTGRPATIGALADIEAMLAGTAGTRIASDVDGVVMAANDN
ncbi:MAG: carbamate kinase [Microthrixaceae bacterium]